MQMGRIKGPQVTMTRYYVLETVRTWMREMNYRGLLQQNLVKPYTTLVISSFLPSKAY
ncbi:hypothetical protein Nmel_008148 [Mimus melanotis]